MSRRGDGPAGGDEVRPPRPARPRWQRILLLGAAALVVVGALSAMPLRGWLDQQGEIAGARDELRAIQRENAALRQRLSVLDEPAEIQRMARRDYGLVDVGEESYSILPPATAGVVLPDAWPFDVLADAVAAASTGTTG